MLGGHLASFFPVMLIEIYIDGNTILHFQRLLYIAVVKTALLDGVGFSLVDVFTVE